MEATNSFVITALQSWSATRPGNAQCLAEEISLTDKTLYVNPPLDMAAMLLSETDEARRKNRVLRGSEPALRRMSDNLWVLEPPIVATTPPKIFSDVVFDMMVRRNSRRYAEVINWAAEYIGIDDFHLLIDNDFFRAFYLDEFLGPELTIYYRHDNLASLPYWKRHGRRLEMELVRKSDVIITSNDALAEEVRGYNFNTFNIGTGTDLRAFDRRADHRTPSDLYGIPRPIIGFAGMLGVMHLSPNLIHRVATALPQCSVVLVGGEDNVFARHALHDLHNVFFLGEKDAKELPSYIHAFDVCINPETRNDFTNASSCNCVPHYLAMGKNVVATATDAMFPFMRHVTLARDEGHFIDSIAQALLNRPTDGEVVRREEFSRTLSWRNCADRLRAVIDLINADTDHPHREEFFEDELLYS